MESFIELRKSILKCKTTVDSLALHKQSFRDFYTMLENDKKVEFKELEAFIRLCLDFYVYSESGEVLINDIEYDAAMNYWEKLGNEHITYPDTIQNITTWGFVKHEMPGIVGTLRKVYSPEELNQYLKKNQGVTSYIVAPKYDGISVSIEKLNNEIIQGVTRADGIEGQNITAVVKGAKNSSQFTRTIGDAIDDGFYKCELLVGQKEFLQLVEEKKYANRRSATSGIVNNPSNIEYAKYISIVPFLHYHNGSLNYNPPGSKHVIIHDIDDAMKYIYQMLDEIRGPDFQYRTDGVVLFPISDGLILNQSDFMDHAIAYKINTAENKTRIKYGYVSLGRLGNAVPMLKVEPVEVNETIVDDVSLSSFDKYASLDLHENETVIVYSAGDVIPMVKIPEHREWPKGADYLKISKTCPYCNEKLERIVSEYKCTNPECPRLITGKITNFLTKLGIKNVSDKTIEDLYQNKKIKTIEDVFDLELADIFRIPGYDVLSATNILKEIHKVIDQPTTYAKLFGAIGIPNISTKKCQKIFEVIDADYIVSHSADKVYWKLLNADGVGDKTANAFTDYMKENGSLVRYLLKHMKFEKEIKYIGNVVYTGFTTDEELEAQLNQLGFEVSNSMNSHTFALVSASYDRGSGKCIKALAKNIHIYNHSETDDLIKDIKKYIRERDYDV